jgi:transcriptional regulator GlxA family with amidase domain
MGEPLRADETLAVGIVLYDEVEELDFCGPFETFAVAAALSAREPLHRERPAFSVFTVAERAELVKTGNGLRIQPDYGFQSAPPVDIVVVPGGNANPQLENTALLEWLKHATSHARISASVCTGAFILGRLGLLEGRAATTHWGALDELAAMFPRTRVDREVRWVDEDSLITAAGISAGIDMSLHVVDRLLGRQMAEATARMMEYRWNEGGD